MAKKISSSNNLDLSKVDKNVLARSKNFANACQETFIQLLGAENGQAPSLRRRDRISLFQISYQDL